MKEPKTMSPNDVESKIAFLLNDQVVTLKDVAPDAMLLEYLRGPARLRGTKEGCNEGDCGACTVLIGRLRDGVLSYAPMNACIRFLAQVDGCHVVTIEHLRGENGALHPVQDAMLHHHGSQCGFCTPGIVMALYALWMNNPHPNTQAIKTALQGNLCRCTGYAPILRAAMDISADPAQDFLANTREWVKNHLTEFASRDRNSGAALLPKTIDAALRARRDFPDARVIAGATDVGLWVNKHLKEMPQVLHLSQVSQLDAISDDGNSITLGAGATYSDAKVTLTSAFPALGPYLDRIAGWQVRSSGTIGGNIANGSPIGDMPPALIALGSNITLANVDKTRTIALEEFFIDYGKQDLRHDELLLSITIPRLKANQQYFVQKISKRQDDDISAVSMGISWVTEAGHINAPRIAYGGMGPTPARAFAAEKALEGAPLTEHSFEAAAKALAGDFTPITDMRASAEYRMLAAQNLLRRVYLQASNAAHSNLSEVL